MCFYVPGVGLRVKGKIVNACLYGVGTSPELNPTCLAWSVAVHFSSDSSGNLTVSLSLGALLFARCTGKDIQGPQISQNFVPRFLPPLKNSLKHVFFESMIGATYYHSLCSKLYFGLMESGKRACNFNRISDFMPLVSRLPLFYPLIYIAFTSVL